MNQSIAGATILARAVSKGKHYTASGLSKAFFISSLEFKIMELEQTLDEVSANLKILDVVLLVGVASAEDNEVIS